MIRFILSALLMIAAIAGVSAGMHFSIAIGLALVATILTLSKFFSMEEQGLLS